MLNRTPNAEYSPNRWGNIDEVATPNDYIGYLDFAASLPAIQRIRERMRELMRIQLGDQILDAGCGTGDETQELAHRVGEEGRVTGIDFSQTMVDEASRRFGAANQPLRFLRGDVESLDFAAGSFDACRAERLLVHLALPQRAVDELVRVARPGGRIVIHDSDWETLIIETSHSTTSRAVADMHCRANGTRRIVRQLGNLLIAAGLVDVEIESTSLLCRNLSDADRLFKLKETVWEAVRQSLVAHDEAVAWLADVQNRDTAGTFLAHLTGFIASGRKR